jgi:hypothetical protein
MNIFLFTAALAVFPSETNALEIVTETSVKVWTWTPRWTIEPYPAYQVFLVNSLGCSWPFFSTSQISLGVDAGFANRSHFTNFYSYASWGLDDSDIWLMLHTTATLDVLVKIAVPTGSYCVGLSKGAYGIEIYLRKAQIMRKSKVYLGYEWIGINPDKVNYGDKIRLGLEIYNWLEISSYYAFADEGTYYSLHDSPSFALEVSICRNFQFMKACSMDLLFKQTLLGKDTPISTSISLRISKRD